MKRRVITVIFAICLTLSLTACGSTKVESEKDVVVENDNEAEEDEDEISEAKDDESENDSDDSKTGTVEQGDGFTKVPVVTDKALNYTGTAGPINYSIDAIQISKLTATTDDAAFMFDIEKDKEVALVVLDVTVENTSEEDVSFYMDQATLISSTKEQVDANMWLSDHIDGDYLGQVVKSGTLMYILPNSNADDISSISLRISAPIDTEWNTLSEDISIDLSFE